MQTLPSRSRFEGDPPLLWRGTWKSESNNLQSTCGRRWIGDSCLVSKNRTSYGMSVSQHTQQANFGGLVLQYQHSNWRPFTSVLLHVVLREIYTEGWRRTRELIEYCMLKTYTTNPRRDLANKKEQRWYSGWLCGRAITNVEHHECCPIKEQN